MIHYLEGKENSEWLQSEAAIRGVLYKKSVLKNFPKFTGKHLYQSLFFNKVAGLSLQLY